MTSWPFLHEPPRDSGRTKVLQPYLIPIEFGGSSSAVRSNVESNRAAPRCTTSRTAGPS